MLILLWHSLFLPANEKSLCLGSVTLLSDKNYHFPSLWLKVVKWEVVTHECLVSALVPLGPIGSLN